MHIQYFTFTHRKIYEIFISVKVASISTFLYKIVHLCQTDITNINVKSKNVNKISITFVKPTRYKFVNSVVFKAFPYNDKAKIIQKSLRKDFFGYYPINQDITLKISCTDFFAKKLHKKI